MNRRNEITRSRNQAKIVESIYSDELFGFMTFKELLEATGLTRTPLSNHLRELTQEVKRERRLYSELSKIISKHPELERAKPGEPIPIRRSLRTPILITKQGVYTLHPITRWALDRGIFPRIAQERRNREPEPYSRLRHEGD